MDIPHSFKEKLQRVEQREAREKREKQKEEAKERAVAQTHRQKEEQLYPKKLEISKTIFSWREAFCASSEGKKILRRAIGHTTLYDGKWGHSARNFDNHGCWSCLLIDKAFCGKTEVISYRAGYKAQGFQAYYDFDKPQEMAEKLNYDYLKKVLDHLVKGGVWNVLEEEI